MHSFPSLRSIQIYSDIPTKHLCTNLVRLLARNKRGSAVVLRRVAVEFQLQRCAQTILPTRHGPDKVIRIEIFDEALETLVLITRIWAIHGLWATC